MARREKKDPKESRVTAAYYRTCNGIQISIFDMSKIVEVGLQAIEQGQDDDALGVTIRAYVETIRKN